MPSATSPSSDAPRADAGGAEDAEGRIQVIYDAASERCREAIALVKYRESTLPVPEPTVQLYEWPSAEAEAALQSLPPVARPLDMCGRIVARLPTGLVLPRCDLDVMELIYEMEYLALLQPPDPSRASTIAQAYLKPGPCPASADGQRWWGSDGVYDGVARSLADVGFCVLDEFLQPQVAEDLLRATLVARPRMAPGVHGRQEVFDSKGHSNNPKRCDLILFSDDYSGMPGYQHLADAVDRLVLGLKFNSSCREVSDRLRFVDFANSAQFSIYPGDASRYVRHADNSMGDGRCLTAILYLNQDWELAHGGRLRLFEPTLTRLKADVDPIWNRLVLFWSNDEVPHEVLASYRDRVAVSIWYLSSRESLGSRSTFPSLLDAAPFRVIGGRTREEALAEAAEGEEQRRALAEVPRDAEVRGSYLAEQSSRLEQLFGWAPEAAETGLVAEEVERPSSASPSPTRVDAAPVVSRPVERVAAGDGRAAELQAAGRPVVVQGALPELSGARVLDFMPALVQVSGNLIVQHERQGLSGEVTIEQASVRQLMQKLESSAPGCAYLTVSREALDQPRLVAFLGHPSCCEPDLLDGLPLELEPDRRRALVLAGRGARSRLRRDPLTGCGWHALVLGEQQWRLFPPETDPASLGTTLGEWGSGDSHFDAFAWQGAELGVGQQPAEMWEATQRMGEVLLVPPGWWYQARYVDKTLGITAPYATPGTIPLVIDQVSELGGTSATCSQMLKALRQLRDSATGSRPSQGAPRRSAAVGSAVGSGDGGEEGGSGDRGLGGGESAPSRSAATSDDGAEHGGGGSASKPLPWSAFFINLARRRDRRASLAKLLGTGNEGLLERLERVDAVDGRQLSFDDRLVQLAVDAPALERARRASESGAHTIVHEGGSLLHFDNHLTLGAIACALSHRMALERLLMHPTAEWALVLEDDISAVVPDVDLVIHRLLQRLPEDWDALFLGFHATGGRPHPSALAAEGATPAVGAPDAASVAVLPLAQPLFGLYAWVVRKSAAEALLQNVFPISGQVDYAITRWLVYERGRSYFVDPASMLVFSPKSEVAEDSDIQTMTTLGAMLESHGSWEGYCESVYEASDE